MVNRGLGSGRRGPYKSRIEMIDKRIDLKLEGWCELRQILGSIIDLFQAFGTLRRKLSIKDHLVNAPVTLMHFSDLKTQQDPSSEYQAPASFRQGSGTLRGRTWTKCRST